MIHHICLVSALSEIMIGFGDKIQANFFVCVSSVILVLSK